MILSDKVDIKINPSNYKRFKGKVGEVITISPFDLSKGSHVKINVKCDDCQKESKVKWNIYVKNYSNGDWLCRDCKRKKNLNEKYGVDNVFQLKSVKDKSKETLKSKYGVDNISKLDSVKEKRKETSIEKYGVEHYMQLESNKIYGQENISNSEEVKESKKLKWENKTSDEKNKILEKRKETNLKRYGVEWTLMDEDILNKILKTNNEKYNYDNPSKSEKVKKKIRESNIITSQLKMVENIENLKSVRGSLYEIKCDICSNIFEIQRSLFYKRREKNNIICTKCNEISKNISSKELEISNYIKSIYDGDIILSDRKILEGKELDIFIPDHKFGIEFNGNYWHSELYKPKNYHKEKFDMCQNRGVFLLQVYEDDWDFRKDIVKSMIKNRLKLTSKRIYARKCEVKEINDNNIIREFLENNHIQGYVGSSIKLGLYFNNKLVSLVTFKRDKEVYNLNRFCNLRNHSIIGGFSKILKYFIRNYSDKIITFSNNDYSDGNLYMDNGFKKEYNLRPDYSYVLNGVRNHKFGFRKNKIRLNENLKFYEGETEHEIMLKNDIYRIYDSGKIKWRY